MKDYSNIPVLQNHMDYINAKCKEHIKDLNKAVQKEIFDMLNEE